MDSNQALGISFHSIGTCRPTAVQDLKPGTQLTVKFESGHVTGSMTKATPKWANVSFNDGIYSVDSHTSYIMHMPCQALMDYSQPSHFQLVFTPSSDHPRMPNTTAQRTRVRGQ